MKQFSRRWVSAMKNSDPWWRGNKTGPQPAQLSARKEVPASEGKRVESGHPPSWRNRARRPGRPRHWRSGQNTGGDSAALRRAASRHALRSAWVRRTASRGEHHSEGSTGTILGAHTEPGTLFLSQSRWKTSWFLGRGASTQKTSASGWSKISPSPNSTLVPPDKV